MRKFTKVFILLLSVVLLVTAFCVVAMASDTDDIATLEKKHARIRYYDYETGTKGSLSWNANPSGAGTFEIAVAEDGSKYIQHHVSAGTGNAGYLTGPDRANKTYSISEYPYLSIDFDICKTKEEGDYAGAGVTAFYFGNGNVYDDFGNLSGTLNYETGGNTTIDIGKIKKYLPAEAMTWAHVTMIFKYHIQNDTQYIGIYAYVDGKLVYLSDTFHTMNTKRLASNYYFGTFRINNSGNTNTTNFSGYDNLQFNFFNGAYTMDEVVSFVYNDSYELPYGITIATVGNRVYDTIPKAIEEAKPGEVIKLLADVPGVINIDKTVTIDTNKYDEEGNPTGDFYEITTSSTTLVSETKDGIITFKQVQNASVQVYWDDCPGKAAGKECKCDPMYLDENGNHIMEAFTATAMLNSLPTYPGEIPTFPVIDGKAQNFMGWSYTQGGEVEAIKTIGPDDVADGWIALYPVYESICYSFEILSSDGKSNGFYIEEDYALAIDSVPNGGTLKFHADIEASDYIELSSRTLAIDLNGYSFKSAPYVKTYRGDNSSGEWVAVGDPISTEGNDVGIGFQIVGKGELTFKSSRPGASIYNVKPTVTVIVDDAGNVVNESVSLKTNIKFIDYRAANPHTINILGDVSIYTYYRLVSNDWDLNVNGGFLNIDGASIYCLGDATLFLYNEGSIHVYKNTKFYFIKGSLLTNYTNNGTLLARDIKTTVTLENCDIYTTNNKGGAPSFSYSVDKDSLTIYNSRIFTVSYNSSRTHIGDGAYLVSDTGNVLDPCVRDASTATFTYTPVNDILYEWDEVNSKLVYVPQTSEVTKTASYYVYNPNFGPTTVTFKDLEGNVISTVAAKKNNPVEAPSFVDLGDGYRNLLNPIWRDQNGDALGATLGDADEYVFTAELPDEADRQYGANLTVAMMNMSYYSKFAYNLYVPKTDGVNVISVDGESSLNTVLIDGAEYYVFTKSVDVLDALNAWSATVIYEIDGESFISELSLSAYVYAMASVSSDKHTAADKAAAGALISLVEQAIKYEIGFISDDVQALLDSFYAEYTPAAWVTEYPAEELCDINVDAVGGLIESIGFRVFAGSRVCFAVTLTDDAVALGYKVIVDTFEMVSLDGKTFCTDSLPVYATLMNPVYKIEVVDAEDNVVVRDIEEEQVSASTKYSMATYLKAMTDAGENVDVVKAFYAFGKSVIDVRNSIYN